MKKHLLAAAVIAAVAVTAAPATAVAAPTTAPKAMAMATDSATATATDSASTAGGAITLVRSGERIDAGGGFTVWLTEDGKHWSGPDGYENFRSVVDGNVDLSRPGVSHQSEGDAAGVFHSGLYYGTKKAGRVELTAADGRKTPATLLELPGRPGWGVWYAHTDASGGGAAVALYGRDGRLLAELPPF